MVLGECFRIRPLAPACRLGIWVREPARVASLDFGQTRNLVIVVRRTTFAAFPVGGNGGMAGRNSPSISPRTNPCNTRTRFRRPSSISSKISQIPAIRLLAHSLPRNKRFCAHRPSLLDYKCSECARVPNRPT